MNPSSYQATGNPTLPHSYANASNSASSAGNYETPGSAGAEGRPERETYASNLAEQHPLPVATVESSQPTGAHNGAASAPPSDAASKLAQELNQFTAIARQIRQTLTPAATFHERCRQSFDVANDLFGNAPTWVCFYRELMGANGLLHVLFDNNKDFGAFLRTDQYHLILGMLTGLRGRDLPENDPNDPQRMITVRLPKSLHEAMCEEAGRLNISVNRLCISRMLQLLDPAMIPETHSKPRGRKPRTRTQPNPAPTSTETPAPHTS